MPIRFSTIEVKKRYDYLNRYYQRDHINQKNHQKTTKGNIDNKKKMSFNNELTDWIDTKHVFFRSQYVPFNLYCLNNKRLMKECTI